MRLGDRILGAVNIYSAGPRPWSDDDVGTAKVLADMATSYLVNASELEKSRRTAEQLHQALLSRIVIEQAKGILAAERKDLHGRRLRGAARARPQPPCQPPGLADAVVNLGLRP